MTSKPQMNEASGAGWRTVSSVRAGLWSFARLWKVHLATGSHASQLFINILSFLMRNRNARKRDAATSWWIPQLAASGFLLSFLGAYLEVCPREELVGGSSRGRTAAFSKDRLVGSGIYQCTCCLCTVSNVLCVRHRDVDESLVNT